MTEGYIVFTIDGVPALCAPWGLWLLCALAYGLLCAAAGGLLVYYEIREPKMR